MAIDRQEVERIAALARLTITEGEKEQFGAQLSQILNYVDQLNEIDTDGVPQTSTVSTETNVLRDDEVRPSLPVDAAVHNAPQEDRGMFVVPKIIADRG